MYQVQPQPDPTATLFNGSQLTPLATLKDEYGGVAHIIVDDHCYVLVVKAGREDGRVVISSWWFREAVEAARTLPLPS